MMFKRVFSKGKTIPLTLNIDIEFTKYRLKYFFKYRTDSQRTFL